MASGRFPFVWEADFQNQETHRATADVERSSRVDLPHGRLESNLGERRASTARFSCSVSRSQNDFRGMKRAPRKTETVKRGLAFLRNHWEAIVAMNFFTGPTITFGVLYCFFVIAHSRRRILHLNVARHPTSLWAVQQLREEFPFESAPRHLIFDRDGKDGTEVPAAVGSLTIAPS